MIELHGKLSIKRLSGMVNLVHVKASDDMLQAKTVTPSTSQQVVTPDTGSGYTALSRVTVEAVKLQNKTVTPGSAAQSVQADDGSTGLGVVTVEAAPLQEITAEIAAEIQHLVPDPGFYGFSGVTIKALPDAETAAFCESIELPAIPADVLAAYPYAVITEVDNGGTTIYLLAAAESAFFYGPGSIIGQSYDKFLGSLGAGTAYYTTAEGTSWTKVEDRPAGSVVTEMADTSRVVYSNHDIYQVEDDGSGSLSVDTLYYAKSGLYGVAVSDAYRIQRETMEALGDQVNRLTGTAESMPPGRMTQKLEDLNIQLQEITVTATEEEQVITPSTGFYGFSKVIVEAVEDSGGTGGGTGGENEEPPGSAEDTTFGDEYVTGNYDYSSGTDENPSYIPEIPGDGDYKVLFSKKLKAGQLFRYTWNGKEYDLKTNEDAYLYNAFGTVGSFVQGVSVPTMTDYVFLYHPSNDILWYTKLATATEWNASIANMTYYADPGGYFYTLCLIEGGGNANTGEIGNGGQCKGLPRYDLGNFSKKNDLMAAMRSVAVEKAAEDDNEQFIAFCSDTPILCDGSVINNTDNSPMAIYEVDAADTNTWVLVGMTDGSDYPISGYTTVWNSHDLMDMDGEFVTRPKSDDPVAETSPGGVAKPVERNETYYVEGSTMNTLVGAAQKVTGNTAPMTPDEAANALDEYYSQPAEELTF